MIEYGNKDQKGRWTAGVEALSGTSITPSGKVNVVDIAQLSGTTTINAPTTGVVDGNAILLRFTDANGQTVNFATGAGNYIFGTDIASGDIPTTAAKGFEVLVRYHSTSNRWRVVALVRGF